MDPPASRKGAARGGGTRGAGLEQGRRPSCSSCLSCSCHLPGAVAWGSHGPWGGCQGPRASWWEGGRSQEEGGVCWRQHWLVAMWGRVAGPMPSCHCSGLPSPCPRTPPCIPVTDACAGLAVWGPESGRPLRPLAAGPPKLLEVDVLGTEHPLPGSPQQPVWLQRPPESAEAGPPGRGGTRQLSSEPRPLPLPWTQPPGPPGRANQKAATWDCPPSGSSGLPPSGPSPSRPGWVPAAPPVPH